MNNVHVKSKLKLGGEKTSLKVQSKLSMFSWSTYIKYYWSAKSQNDMIG